jgi:ATP-dependent helicase/nuclease subunit A
MITATDTPGAQQRLPNEVIRASAGSGKTYQLTNRYLRLLLAGAAADSILATTFTRKAAGEILDRILSRLAGAAVEEAKARQLGLELELPRLSRSACLSLLVQLTRHLHRLRISTLDALFMKMAGSCSLELELPPGWRIVEETVASRTRDRAIQAVLSEGKLADLLTLLNLLSKGEAERSISRLLRDSVDNLYALWQESEQAAWHKVPKYKPLGEERLAATIEQIMAASLPAHKGIVAAREKDMQQALEGNWSDFLQSGIARKVLDGQPVMWNKSLSDEIVAQYQTLITHARAILVGQLAGQTEAAWQLLARFDQRHRQLQFELGGLRFNDITRVVAQGQGAIGPRLALRMGGGVEHLLLDEFQDTSINQWQALRPLAQRTATPQPDRSFFCVGDIKQAIYRWRGGESEIFDALHDELPQIEERPLDTSYRSSPVVIDSINRIFRGMLQHGKLEKYVPAMQHWLKQYHDHSTARGSLAGYVTLETSAQFGNGRSTPAEHWEHVARRIKQLAENAPGASIGVLVRKNETVARLIYELKAIGVAASEEGGNPLIDSAAVELILSLIRLADHPGDTRCWFHVAASPLGAALGYGDHRQQHLAARLAGEVRSELFHQGYGACVERWAILLAPSTAQRDWNRLEQLTEAAYRYDLEATLRPHEFIELVEAQRVADPTADPIRVMTVHQSKGLQFDCVVLPELENRLRGQPPSFVTHRPTPTSPVDTVMHYASEDVQALLPAELQQLFDQTFAADVHESMCLLYVALTRAVHALHMIVLPQDPGKKKAPLPKTFAGLLRAALTDGDPLPGGETVFAAGDPAWVDSEHSPRPSKAPDEAIEIDAAPGTIHLNGRQPPRARIMETVSPSSLEGGSRVNVAQYFRESRETILLRGSVVHAWLEAIGWLEEGLPDEGELMEIAAGLEAPLEESRGWLKSFRQALERPEVAAPLRQSFYRDHPQLGAVLTEDRRAEVFAEQRIYVREPEHILDGFIDRLVVVFEGTQPIAVEVLDYKTDWVKTNSELNEKVNYYRPQLEAYCRAVSQMWKLPPEKITARLIFVERGQSVAIDSPSA